VTPRHPDTDRLAALLREVIDDWIAERKRNGFEGWTDSMMRSRDALREVAAGLSLPAEPEAPDLHPDAVYGREWMARLATPPTEDTPG
jgi:hypothetical protein